jgi:beta-N-acetylhexosaminidase
MDIKLDLPSLSDLTLDQKIAQMMLVGFRGFQLEDDNPLIRDLREHMVGGIILFDYDVLKRSHERNISTPAQLEKLMSQIYSHLQVSTFISIDQEGGTVNRLKPEYGFPHSYSHKELGEEDDVVHTEKHGQHIAQVLRSYGINLNFAPCVDLGINKENKAIYGRNRTFSEDPFNVTAHARAYINGHRKEGVLTALKHFPGHGSSLADTHLGMADVTDTWSQKETIPYEILINEGLCEMVMTTHIFNRNLDPKFPGTLSRAVISGMLREKLNFEGVIISDDLQMQAITNHFGLDSVVELALIAGVDILAFGNNLAWEPDIVERCTRIVKELLDAGTITEERLDTSVKRILSLKKTRLA